MAAIKARTRRTAGSPVSGTRHLPVVMRVASRRRPVHPLLRRSRTQPRPRPGGPFGKAEGLPKGLQIIAHSAYKTNAMPRGAGFRILFGNFSSASRSTAWSIAKPAASKRPPSPLGPGDRRQFHWHGESKEGTARAPKQPVHDGGAAPQKQISDLALLLNHHQAALFVRGDALGSRQRHLQQLSPGALGRQWHRSVQVVKEHRQFGRAQRGPDALWATGGGRQWPRPHRGRTGAALPQSPPACRTEPRLPRLCRGLASPGNLAPHRPAGFAQSPGSGPENVAAEPQALGGLRNKVLPAHDVFGAGRTAGGKQGFHSSTPSVVIQSIARKPHGSV